MNPCKACDKRSGQNEQQCAQRERYPRRRALALQKQAVNSRELKTGMRTPSAQPTEDISCSIHPKCEAACCVKPYAHSRYPPSILGLFKRYGAPGWTRTSDHRLRRTVLYPTELRERGRVHSALFDETGTSETEPTTRKLAFGREAILDPPRQPCSIPAMRTRIALVLCASLSTVALSSATPARAQPAQDDAATKAARARFLEGVAFFDKQDFENARLSFMQAYSMKKHPSVLLNLALSCAKSNHPLEAARHFQSFLRDSQNLTADKRREGEDGLRDVRKKLGTLAIAAPAGAEISIDGERVAGVADEVDVEPGARTVTARLPDGTILAEKVTAVAGSRAQVRLGAGGPATDPPKVDPAKVDPAKVGPGPVEPPSGGPGPSVPPKAGPGVGEPPTGDGTGPLAPGEREPGILSPPETMVPVFIGLGVGVVGLASTIAFAAAKSSAQTKANEGEASIRAAALQNGRNPSGICALPPTSAYATSCAALRDNLSTVDSNATAANISAVVMTIGFVGAAGWYLFAPKAGKKSATGPTARIVPAPTLHGGSLTVVGTF